MIQLWHSSLASSLTVRILAWSALGITAVFATIISYGECRIASFAAVQVADQPKESQLPAHTTRARLQVGGNVTETDGDTHQKEGVRRVFAFAEFFAIVEKEYPRFFDVSQRVLTAMHSVADRAYPNPEPHQRAILNLSMLAGISFVEVVTLTGNGLGHGAMRILRSLLETSINVEFFRVRPEEFEDYKEWYHVERFKEQEFLREHAAPIFATLDSQVVVDNEREMTKVRPRFERVAHDGSRRLRGSWSSLDLGARAVATGFEDDYRVINPLASSFVHETMYGMLRHFDAAKDVNRVEVPPTLDWSVQALSGAHHSMVRVVKTLSQTFDVPSDPPVDVLEREWRYAWTDPR